MKRILDSSRTVRRHANTNVRLNDDKFAHVAHLKRSFSVPTHEKISNEDFVKSKLPDRLHLYWSLDEENKRKISELAYVKQAVHDTFMQRSNGGYHYRKPSVYSSHTTTSSLPSNKNSKSKKTKDRSERQLLHSNSQSADMSRYDNILRKHTKPALKKITDVQLESYRKKMYDPTPKPVDYSMEKRPPKASQIVLKTRMDKFLADTKIQHPPVMQRLREWKKHNEGKPKQTDISITPRAIALQHLKYVPKSEKTPMSKQLMAENDVNTNYKHFQNQAGSLLKTLSSVKKKPLTVKGKKLQQKSSNMHILKEKSTQQLKTNRTQAYKMQSKMSTTKPKLQTELTPQIYPKGSLSLRKSFMPITPCLRTATEYAKSRDPPSSNNVPIVRENPGVSISSKTKHSPSLTNLLIGSLKSLFYKIRQT